MSQAASPASISLDQLIALNDEIVALVRAGVPIELGLVAWGRDIRGPMGQIAVRLGERLNRGETLEDVIADDAERFPPIYRAVVQAGLKSGRLAVALEQLASSARRLAELRRFVGLALSYPLLVTLTAYALLVLFLAQLAPAIASAFPFFRLPPEPVIEALVAASRSVRYWGPVFPLLLVGLTGWWWWRSGRAKVLQTRSSAWLFGCLPWIHRMLVCSRAAAFAEVSSLLLRQGLSLDQSLSLAAGATGDRALRQSAEDFAAAIRQGRSRGEAATLLTGLPPLLIWLVAADRPGHLLATALAHAADSYRRRAVHHSDVARIMTPVVFTIGLGGIAALAYAAAVFYPWINLLKGMSH